MALLAALIALGSKFAGKVLTTALGWAATLLFGRVPADRQILLVGITFGSVIWLALLVGVLVPDVGTFLLLLVPARTSSRSRSSGCSCSPARSSCRASSAA